MHGSLSNVCALKRDLTVSAEVLNDDPRIDRLATQVFNT